MKIPLPVALVLVAALLGLLSAMDFRHQGVDAADAMETRIVLAQATSEKALLQDIAALRLQNVIAELESIQARADAGKALAGDATRRRQLTTQMATLIKKLD